MKDKDFVECEVCGCLLKKTTAIKGKSEVRDRSIEMAFEHGYYIPHKREYIYTPYYCKIHQPKTK